MERPSVGTASSIAGVHIIIDASGVPRLDQASDFTAFSIKASDPDQAAVLTALAASGAVASESDHVFVAVDAVRTWAMSGAAVDDAETWEAGFAKMLAYAGSKGWMDDKGSAIKAHIEAL